MRLTAVRYGADWKSELGKITGVRCGAVEMESTGA
jgi:hypothetical protein